MADDLRQSTRILQPEVQPLPGQRMDHMAGIADERYARRREPRGAQAPERKAAHFGRDRQCAERCL